jgi:ABC-2 type transport system ATP-binding protein
MLPSTNVSVCFASVHKSYGQRRALEDFHLTVERGQVFGLLGPNGAGKTTTLRLLMGLLKADSGQLHALGRPCWEQSVELKKRIGYLSADTQIYPWLTAFQALKLFSEIRGQDLTAPGLALCEQLSLEPGLRVRLMSRGNRQKLGLVLALVHRPELLVLDEPTSGFDPLVQNVFAELIQERTSEGATVLLSSHTFEEINRLCQTVAIVKAGKVIVQDALERLRGRAARRITIVFQDDVPENYPPALESTKLSERKMEGQWRGDTGPLVEWCAQENVKDLEISPPLLDDAFLEFYK